MGRSICNHEEVKYMMNSKKQYKPTQISDTDNSDNVNFCIYIIFDSIF